jgi:hypothetical protein
MPSLAMGRLKAPIEPGCQPVGNLGALATNRKNGIYSFKNNQFELLLGNEKGL